MPDITSFGDDIGTASGMSAALSTSLTSPLASAASNALGAFNTISGSGGLGAIGSSISDFSQANVDSSNATAALLGAQGDLAEGKAYGTAATLATQNEAIVGESTRLSQYQASRQLQQNIGSAQAAAGANGLTGGGSAGDIIRSSRQQGALTQQVIGAQGQINENAYAASAASYTGMQQAAGFAAQAEQAQAKADQSASNSAKAGGFLSGLAGVAEIASAFL